MTRWILIVPALVGGAAVAIAAAPAAQTDGAELYRRSCAVCHGKIGMGTGVLARRVDPAVLAERTDLDADFVIQAARTGIGNMPAISRAEVNEAEMKAIADYLATPPGSRAK